MSVNKPQPARSLAKPTPAVIFTTPSHDYVSGTIPDCLGQGQTVLNTVSMEGNRLEGTIPESLCRAPLSYMLLYDNELSGE